MKSLNFFKAYDIRGQVPQELNADIAYRIGLGYAELFRPHRVVLGRDIRPSGLQLLTALAQGLADRGVEVLDIGLCGTEEIYFAASQPGVDGGIMVTASHNPSDYNGMKIVRAGAVPVADESGLRDLEAFVASSSARYREGNVSLKRLSQREAYVRHLLGYVDVAALKPLKIVVNAGNGTAGLVVDALESHLPFQFVKLQHQPDGSFPNGVPNPLLPENRAVTAEAVRANGADLGVAWDGDFDRCFLFDETGTFVDGYYIVGLLAEALLRSRPGEKIIHDPRLTWNTIEVVNRAGGVPVQSRTGHAFIKERMRQENALYGGEMSGHHYFRDFSFCDNGNIPWLLVASLLSVKGASLSSLVGQQQHRYPSSEEINRKVANAQAIIDKVEEVYRPSAITIEKIDGLSVEYADWRFNLRASNTEPLLRLNVESRADQVLLAKKTQELLKLMDAV